MKKIIDYFKKNKKEILIFLGGFILCLCLFGGIFIYNYSEEKKVENKEVKTEKKEKSKIKKEKKTTSIEDVEILQNDNSQENKKEIVEEFNDTNNDNYTPTYSNETISYQTAPTTETEVISYFEEYERLSNGNENNPSIREKLKSGVDTIYRFLFQNGTIKGKTFSELSNSAKLKVLKITLSIDQKIDSYFPNYKDRIKENSKNLKAKVVTKYLETTNKICANNEEICNSAREDFKIMKNSFKISWTLIKEIITTSTYALKEWYISSK